MKLPSKYKKPITVVLIIMVCTVILIDNITISVDNTAEGTAQTFVQKLLDGDADKCAELMNDDLITEAGYETKKLFVHAFDKKLDTLIEKYEKKYGSSWSYELRVIDSFDYNPVLDILGLPPSYLDEVESELESQSYCHEYVKVVIAIDYKGGGLFKEKEGSEELELIMEKIDEDWLVCYFPALMN